jgi:hypothetical protein
MHRHTSKPEHPEHPPKRPRDPNQLAFQVVGELTGTLQPLPTNGSEHRKNPAAVALGTLGGSKGGTARAARLTPSQRSEIAQKAARARWIKKRGEE